MTIEGIKNAVNTVTAGASTNVTKQQSVTETKEVSVQNNKQAADAGNASAVGKNSSQVKDNGVQEESREQEYQISEKALKQRISDINRKLNNNTIAEFGYHDDTNRVTIKIVDKDTKETIKEIPPEKTLDLIAKAWELAGILVDERR